MRRNGRFGQFRSLVLVTAAVCIVPAVSLSVANAQRPTTVDANESVRPARILEVARPNPESQQPVAAQSAGIPGQQAQPAAASVVIVAPNRPFTLATSAGTIDEDSSDIVQLANFNVGLLPLATGSVHVRYNISAVDNVSNFCPATQSTVRVRFRNSDNAGTVSQVSFEIHSTNVTSGGNTVIYSFSSNGRSAGSAFTTATDTPAIDFDFANNIYWIEATVFRSDPNALANLGAIQIWESTGTACP